MINKIIIKRWYTILAIVFAGLMAACGKAGQVTEYSVIPEPAYMVQKGRTFSFTSRTKLYFENLGQNTSTAKYITSSLRHLHLRPSLAGHSHKNGITITLNDTLNPALGNEGYLLQVSPDEIRISANTETGLFYAFQTFVQMLPADIHSTHYNRILLPECTILDYPRFAWRGSCLDVARHFFTVKQIKRHLDLMASYKLNKFHWHLTDDQGWRLEIEKYPQLCDFGAWRVDRTNAPWGEAEPARQGEEPTYGGYYTKDDVAEIVQYAAQRNIEVIPEIEFPSHCCAALAAYPNLACDDYPYTIALGPYWPHKAVLCVGKEEVLTFVLDVLDEVAQMFPGEYIHIGCEDICRDNWESCPNCSKRMHQIGASQSAELQDWFVSQLESFVNSKGKRIIGWDEMLDCHSLGVDAVVMSARGDNNIIRAALRGNQVVAARSECCGLEAYQADSAYHPAGFPMLLPLSKAYLYDPIPHGLPANADTLILGGECLLWTDYIQNYAQAEYFLLPRMCALAEAFWTQADRKDWSRFQNKIEAHKQWLSAAGFNVCPGSFRPIVAIAEDQDYRIVTLATEVANTFVYYTTDGSEPTLESAVYSAPLRLPKGMLLRTLSYYQGQIREGVYNFPL